MGSPDVSYIIPTYDVPKAELLGALESVSRDLTSTESRGKIKVEVVVTDDGSKAEFVSEYESVLFGRPWPFIPRLVKGETNSGLGANLNRAIQTCSSKYIIRLDPDDRNIVGRTFAQVAVLSRGADFVACGVVVKRAEMEVNTVRPLRSRKCCLLACRFGSPFFHSSLAMKRSVFSVVRYPERGSGLDRIEDLVLVFLLLVHGKSHRSLSGAYVEYQDADNSLSKIRSDEIAVQRGNFIEEYIGSVRMGFPFDIAAMFDLATRRRAWFVYFDYFIHRFFRRVDRRRE